MEAHQQPKSNPGMSPLDLTRLQDHLHLLFSRHRERSSLLPEFLYFLVNLVNAGAASFEICETTETLTEKNLISKQAAGWAADLPAVFRACAARAMAESQPLLTPLAENAAIKIFSIPITGTTQPAQAFSVALLVDRQAPEIFLLVLQLVASCFAQWQKNNEFVNAGASHPCAKNLQNVLASILMTTDQNRGKTDFVAALKEYFQADTAILEGGGKFLGNDSLVISSLSGIDYRTPHLAIIRQVVEECRQQRTILTWPDSVTALERAIPSMLLRELASLMRTERALCLPLPDNEGKINGTLMLCWHSLPTDFSLKLRDFLAMETLFAGVASWLFVQENPSKIVSFLQEKSRRILVLCLCLLAGLGISFMPVTFKVEADCLLQPKDIRFVVAQFNAILKEVYVTSGREVNPGQRLALLDEKAIELEIGSLLAEIQKSKKLQDVNIAAGATASAQIAGLEREGLELKLSMQKNRLSQLVISSPVRGIVISEDVEQKKGSPISRGQELFEIAALDTMTVEALVEQEDINFINEEAEAKIHLDSFPGQQWIGKIGRIHPKSEIREGRHVFVIEVAIDNEKGILRPGMRGGVAVVAGKKPFIWTLFRKPWLYLLKTLQSV